MVSFGDIESSFMVRARYEKGVLKPLEKIDLKDGEEVIIIIKKSLT